MAVDYAALKKGGFMRQKQKNNLFSETSGGWEEILPQRISRR